MAWGESACTANLELLEWFQAAEPASDSGEDRRTFYVEVSDHIDDLADSLGGLDAPEVSSLEADAADLVADQAAAAVEAIDSALGAHNAADLDGTQGEATMEQISSRLDGAMAPLLQSILELAEAMHLYPPVRVEGGDAAPSTIPVYWDIEACRGLGDILAPPR